MAGIDAAPPDAGPQDAGPPDVGPPDTGHDGGQDACEPIAELCNGVDDDCDGMTDEPDEGPLCILGEICDEAACRIAGRHAWDRILTSNATVGEADLAMDGSGNLLTAGIFSGTADLLGEEHSSTGYPSIRITSDPFVLSMGSDMRRRWVFRGSSSFNDFVGAVAADAAGNIVVVGAFSDNVEFGGVVSSPAGGFDIFVVALGWDGFVKWVRTYGGVAEDYAFGVALDADSNVYVTGEFERTVDFGGGPRVAPYPNSDIFVLSLSASGGYRWDRTFGSAFDDRGTSVAVDLSGNVLVTGDFNDMVDFGDGPRNDGGSALALYVLNLSPEGTHRWDKTWSSSIWLAGNDIATDPDGNILVVGRLEGAVDFGGGERVAAGDLREAPRDVFLLSLSPEGEYRADRVFGGGEDDSGYGIAADSGGRVFVTGKFRGSVDFGGGEQASAGEDDIFVASYDSDLIYRWSRIYGGVGDDVGESILVDHSDHVIVAGSFEDDLDFGGGVRTNSSGRDVFILSLID